MRQLGSVLERRVAPKAGRRVHARRHGPPEHETTSNRRASRAQVFDSRRHTQLSKPTSALRRRFFDSHSRQVPLRFCARAAQVLARRTARSDRVR